MMRLLNARTRLLEEFMPDEVPKYAILSHTWGQDEVSFNDIRGPKSLVKAKSGYLKIRYTCDQALQDGLEYAWIDTCCIDKSSSAELAEAINSMFRWYQDAEVCYAYLSDLVSGGLHSKLMSLELSPRLSGGGVMTRTGRPETRLKRRSYKTPIDEDEDEDVDELCASRWFTRGWTLQELLAPRHVVFFNQRWEAIGDKHTLATQLAQITNIEANIIERPEDIDSASIAQRMSWVSCRRTTRIEDMAYCLLGLFGVHMAPLYGEGKKAFLRLQEEILRDTDDHSLFAWWDESADPDTWHGMFAEHPSMFEGSHSICSFNDWANPSLASITGSGLSIRLSLSNRKGDVFSAKLNCSSRHGPIFLALLRLPGQDVHYTRVRANAVLSHPSGETSMFKPTQVLVRQRPVRATMYDVNLGNRMTLKFNYEITSYHLINPSLDSTGPSLLVPSSPSLSCVVALRPAPLESSSSKKVIFLLLGSSSLSGVVGCHYCDEGAAAALACSEGYSNECDACYEKLSKRYESHSKKTKVFSNQTHFNDMVHRRWIGVESSFNPARRNIEVKVTIKDF